MTANAKMDVMTSGVLGGRDVIMVWDHYDVIAKHCSDLLDDL